MREIKFRGMTRRKGEKIKLNGDPVDGKWVYGGVFPNYWGGDIAIIYQHKPIHKFPVYADTIGQYIGVRDKNGRRIYEGDILKFHDEVFTTSYTSCGNEYDSFEVENYGVVGFDDENAKFDFVQYKYNENQVEADLHENHDLGFADFVQTLEVVGNIYENQELLSEF